MPAQVKQEIGKERVQTLDELAFALGMSRRRLGRLRDSYGPAPEMRADGFFWVEEWRNWLAEIDDDPDADEIESLKKETLRARIALYRFDLDKKRGAVVTLEEHLAALKIPIAAAYAGIDDCEAQLALVLADPAAKERVHALCGAARRRVEQCLADEMAKAEAATNAP